MHSTKFLSRKVAELQGEKKSWLETVARITSWNEWLMPADRLQRHCLMVQQMRKCHFSSTHTHKQTQNPTTPQRDGGSWWFIFLFFVFSLIPVVYYKIHLEENYCCEIMKRYSIVIQDWPSHGALVCFKWCNDLTGAWFHTLFCFVGLWFSILASQWSPVYVISPTCSYETTSREKRF